jgi:cell wall-associated NlpC family hydrolase
VSDRQRHAVPLRAASLIVFSSSNREDVGRYGCAPEVWVHSTSTPGGWPALRTQARASIAALLAVVLLAASLASAAGDPLSAKRDQAAAVQKQIDALNTKAEIATENYNTAKTKYEAVSGQVHKTALRIGRLKASTRVLQNHLGSRADVIYRDGPLDFIAVLLNTKSFDDFNTTLDLLLRISKHDAETVATLKQAKAETEKAQALLLVQQADAKHQRDSMASAERAVKAHLAAQQKILAGVNAQIKAIIAARKAAEAAAALRRYHVWRGGAAGIDPGGNPPTSSKGAAAVWWAEKALGHPYQWAGSGPYVFDCSGLCMWAYRKVGVSLPHSSRMQINCGARVGKGNLEPGDLVFFGSPIHHVGMYVGGGDFIEAPHSGAVVRISSLAGRDDYAGACRP